MHNAGRQRFNCTQSGCLHFLNTLYVNRWNTPLRQCMASQTSPRTVSFRSCHGSCAPPVYLSLLLLHVLPYLRCRSVSRFVGISLMYSLPSHLYSTAGHTESNTLFQPVNDCVSTHTTMWLMHVSFIASVGHTDGWNKLYTISKIIA